MKNIIILSMLVFVFCSSLFSQLPDGEIAPDWTLTDINGTSHTLYDYLDQGKIVFIDVSATWCGPCWSYHNSHALRDLYNTYGPNGTDEVMVFFIEGDGTTTLDDLNGTGSNTWGDWVTGTPYPIINSTAINGSYDIGYFPTVYMICPDRVIKEVGQLTTSQLYSESLTCPDLTTNSVNTKIFEYIEPEGDYCDNPSIRPRVKIQNYGTSDITSLDIISAVNGTPVDTFNWTGFLPMYEVELIVLDELPSLNTGNHLFEFQTENPNGVQDEDVSNDYASGTFLTNSNGTEVTVKIKTDTEPSETSWEIVSGSTVMASGGNYDTDNFIYINGVCLYEDSCYTLIVYDSGNDGLSGTSFGLVMWNGSTIASFPASSFSGDSIHLNFCVGNNNGIENILSEDHISVYPNPACDNVTIYSESFESNKLYTYRLVDILGKTIDQKDMKLNNKKMNISVVDQKPGIYNVLIIDENQKTFNCKLIIN